jgi:DNA polymerase III subunit gamma/tau
MKKTVNFCWKRGGIEYNDGVKTLESDKLAPQVYYRKYRPRTLGEVIGQEPVTRTLLNALKSGRTSHAYLFCGPRGTGKTSMGRALAKAVNCLTTGGKGEPCNTCEMCTAINENRALDFIEIDAASNTSVDDVRTLRERVNISPAQARYKVYLIDEFHMLSTAASNALLKTLEEPPPHVIFILATTEVHKILPTIMSRCQRFDFHRLSLNDIVKELSIICETEHITIDPEALRLIAKSATGSMRDALNLLERLTTYYGPDISFPQVQELLGITGDARVRELVQQIMNEDIKAAIATINSVNNDGLDLRNFKRELVEYLRNLLLIKTSSQDAVDMTADDMTILKEMANKTALGKILKALKLFSQAETGIENNAVLSLELAIIDSIQKAEETPAPPPARQQEQVTPRRIIPEMAPRPATVKPSQTAEVKTGSTPIATTSPKQAIAPEKRSSPSPVAERPVTSNSSPLEAGSIAEHLKQEWRRILDQVPAELRKSPALAILRSAGVQPVGFENGTVVLSFRYAYLKEKLEEIENQKVAEKVLSTFIGQNCRVQCVLENNHLVKEALKMGAEIIDVEEA